ncbi:MAG: protein kinase family protein [Sandaracinaceae bacterium]|nr:protein kinase family protein [Sandaracinaceae bacterium]
MALCACRLFREAAEGISFLHRQSPPVLHRDIKPSNIVILREGHSAVVADLGIAVEDGAHGQLTSTPGSRRQPPLPRPRGSGGREGHCSQ